MSDEDDLQIGRLIAGRYRLTQKLGQGGMGSVWRAEHLTLGSDVAIKLIDQRIAENTEIRGRFIREAQAAAKLRSPHVVQMLDYGVDLGMPFIAMELLSGESLSDRLERLGRLSPQETSRIVTEVCRALSLAHADGIIHRDLKPDNIFLVENDDIELAKVLDFGVAKTQEYGTENASMTTTGAVLGTPYYMSPEQAEGAKDLDHRTDIWAMGVIAYECIVGLRPFDSETLGGLFLAICTRPKPVPSQLVTDLPRGFDQWFEKCTARLVADRFRTAKEAAAALKNVVDGNVFLPEVSVATGHGETAVSGDAWAQTNVARAPLPGATGGLQTTTTGVAGERLDVPRRSSAPLLVVAALVVLGAGVAGYLVMRGGSIEPEESLVAQDGEKGPTAAEEPRLGAASSSAAEPSEAAGEDEDEAPAKGLAEAERSDGPTSASAQSAVPHAPVPEKSASSAVAPAPEPRPVPGPRPTPSPRPSSPRPAPAPAPKAAPKPAPAPTPAAPEPINLGI